MENTPDKKRISFRNGLSFNRKPSGLNNRKGLPSKYSPYTVIDDEEYLLSQTPTKPSVSNLSQ